MFAEIASSCRGSVPWSEVDRVRDLPIAGIPGLSGTYPDEIPVLDRAIDRSRETFPELVRGQRGDKHADRRGSLRQSPPLPQGPQELANTRAGEPLPYSGGGVLPKPSAVLRQVRALATPTP